MITLFHFNLAPARLIVLALFLTAAHTLSAQVNAHARVTGITGMELSVSNVNEAFANFSVGEQVLVIQMQDDVIGSNTGDNTSFGDLANIQQTGLFEVNTIASMTEAGGVPTSITLTNALSNTFNTGANSSVQVVTFPELGNGGDYTTETDIPAVPWDGNAGGIVAFRVSGVLTLAHNITADEAGFRGGANDDGGSAGCTSDVYRIAANGNYGEKGEGIYRVTNADYNSARGKIINGGGGGNSHNAGGGGGGNFTAGGVGGPGWPTCSPSAGGIGGIGLNAYIAASRIFMGGGGGAGEKNNTGPSTGANGGGIIMIQAEELRTSGNCGTLTISAAGGSAGPSVQDGAGGAGAGGTILLEVNSFNIASTCPLAVVANGGDGGNVNHSAEHGGGGGGGMGAVIFSVAQPTNNITTNTDPGTGGLNSNNASATAADPGAGVSGIGQGIIDQSGTPLPIVLGRFDAVMINSRVQLAWTSMTEINNDYFTIERSADGIYFEPVLTVLGAGNSKEPLNYTAEDPFPLEGGSYYRLRQTDFNGTSEVFPPRYVEQATAATVNAFPNPTRDRLQVVFPFELERYEVTVMDMQGQQVPHTAIQQFANRVELNLATAPEGLYLVRIATPNQVMTQKVTVRR